MQKQSLESRAKNLSPNPSPFRRGEEKKMLDIPFELGGKKFKSRLIVGTGKYRDFAETKAAVEESGAEIVTVAVRRVNITDRGKENLLDYIDPKRYQILPNTAGCFTAEEAIRASRQVRIASSAVKHPAVFGRI